MEFTKKYSNNKLIKLLLGKRVHFKSDCELFPNFDVTGRVVDHTYAKNGELILKVKSMNSPRILPIGTNMNRLRFEVLN